jgi:hypothetical protein
VRRQPADAPGRARSPQGGGGRRRSAGGGAGSALQTRFTQARVVRLEAKAAREELELARRRAILVERAAAEAYVFGAVRQVRDALLGWPARVAPELAASFGIDDGRLLRALDEHVAAFLADLASEPRTLDA